MRSGLRSDSTADPGPEGLRLPREFSFEPRPATAGAPGADTSGPTDTTWASAADSFASGAVRAGASSGGPPGPSKAITDWRASACVVAARTQTSPGSGIDTT